MDLFIQTAQFRDKIAFHVNVRRPHQCTRCGCYEVKCLWIIRQSDQWDLVENGGKHPNNTTFIIINGQNQDRTTSTVATTEDFTTLIKRLAVEAEAIVPTIIW